MKVFFLVLARGERHVNEKTKELKALGAQSCARNIERE